MKPVSITLLSCTPFSCAWEPHSCREMQIHSSLHEDIHGQASCAYLVTLVDGAASSQADLFTCSADHLPTDDWVPGVHVQQLCHSTVWFEEDDPEPSSLLTSKHTASLCSACRWHPDVISQGDENTFICAYGQSTQLQKLSFLQKKKRSPSCGAEDGVCVRAMEAGHFPPMQEASGAHWALRAPMAAMDDSIPVGADSASSSASQT